MKKLDKLILSSFFGPFFLTFFITVFILLLQLMLKYFDDIIGKGLPVPVLAEFLFYFSVRITPDALPLAVLLSSLMTFGNLGEHFELSAIKSAGISLIRAIQPIFIFSVLLSVGAYYSNNYIVPAANLKALSLLYDIKQKKPSLDLKEGAFYDGIPNYSIKANKKLDDITLKDVIIYDHTSGQGNNRVIYADSSRMYTYMNEKYLVFELFNGNLYEEFPNTGQKSNAYGADQINQFTRNGYKEMKIVFSLSSFDLKRTKEDLFAGDYRMKSIESLGIDIDSLSKGMDKVMFNIYKTAPAFYDNHLADKLDLPEKYLQFQEAIDAERKTKVDSMQKIRVPVRPDSSQERSRPQIMPVTKVVEKAGMITFWQDDKKTGDTKEERKRKRQLQKLPADTTWQGVIAATQEPFNKVTTDERKKSVILDNALRSARNVRSTVSSSTARLVTMERESDKNATEMYRKYAQAAACFTMFLIGAPLGAIIKKGGLGVPVIISIFFYILYYVLNILSIKWAREDLVPPLTAAWISNMVLFPVGLFFLRQARKDARLFDTDFYLVILDKVKVALKR
ncbi:MAG: LptF/LptG family permease [Cyclobacteriaceae bacterium]